jgi:predicted nucleic acid-binding protein
MGVYVDGSALSRYLIDATSTGDWCAWAAVWEAELLTTTLGVNELRRAAAWKASADRAVAHGVTERLRVVPFSDQAFGAAVTRAKGLTPFQALHLGVALTEPDVDRLATYDARLARTAAAEGLHVVSPGRRAGWWHQSDGDG